MRVAVISDLFAPERGAFRPSLTSVANSTAFVPQDSVPTAEGLADFDLTVVLGTVANTERAIELSGVLDHLLYQGRAVALLYPVGLNEPGLAAIMRRLVRRGYTSINQAVQVESTAPAWDRYFRIYGWSVIHFPDESDNARIIGVMSAASARPPSALQLTVHDGALYVIPFHVGDLDSRDSLERVVRDLVDAIESDMVGDGIEVEYLAELRLPGEEEALQRIAELEDDLDTRRAEAKRLYRYRMLLGPLSGDALEALVRDTLEIVLEPTDLRVDDRPERFGEDFWITGPEGDVALAEVKGINSGVGRAEINQVDNHREELGHDTSELPGLLVVNVYRKDNDLDRKISERVHPKIVAALQRQNVTLLRSADLYCLLAQRMRGAGAGEALIDALAGGGGWLEVTEDGPILHGGDEAS